MRLHAFVLAAAAAAAGAQVTGFDNGTEGWSVSGRDDISPTGGNPGANMDVQVLDVFGADVRNATSPFARDYRNFGLISFTIDVQVDNIDFFGQQVSRDLVVELRNFDTPGTGGFASIWAHLGTLSPQQDWTRYSVDLDTTAFDLPSGWNGAGGEDPNTFEPILPPGVTVQDVLSGVDEIAFTTFVPGFFYGFTNFDLSVDNVGVVVPAPGGALVLPAGLMLAGRRRRA
jgi:hypothetical protein